MKKSVLLCILFSFNFLMQAQLKSRVDERFELVGIVFRLAESDEFTKDCIKSYTQSVDKYFKKYKNHELINYVKSIRASDNIYFSAVPYAAYLLQIKNNRVSIIKNADLDCFEQSAPRWKKEHFLKFSKLLDKFYRDTKFNRFFSQQKPLYTEAEKRFDKLISQIHTEWFQSFFGKPIENVDIFLSIINGENNYGGLTLCDSNKIMKCIVMGSANEDDKGMPIYDNSYLYVVIHELCHVLTNPLLKDSENGYLKTLIPSAEKMLPYVKEQLKRNSYKGAETLVIESFNNLFTNLYYIQYLPGWDVYRIRYSEQSGFVFMHRAVSFMNNFHENRQLYPHIQDFMPQLCSFFKNCGNDIEKIVFEYENANPYVINVFPAQNSTVSSDIKEVIVQFNQPMWGSFGIMNSDIPNRIMPNNDKSYWSKDYTTLHIPVILEKGKSYGFKLPYYMMQSHATYEMKKDFDVFFSTIF